MFNQLKMNLWILVIEFINLVKNEVMRYLFVLLLLGSFVSCWDSRLSEEDKKWIEKRIVQISNPTHKSNLSDEKTPAQSKSRLNILIADPGNIIEGVISSKENQNISYYFVDGYLDLDEFKRGKDYQKFDALIEVNEKVLNNKKVFVFYRKSPSSDIKNSIKFHIERRIEEVMIQEFTSIKIEEYRKIRLIMDFDFRNIDEVLKHE